MQILSCLTVIIVLQNKQMFIYFVSFGLFEFVRRERKKRFWR